jgi:hypothetical protein
MISGSLDRFFSIVESCGRTVQLFDKLILAPLLELPGHVLNAGRDLAGIETNLRKGIFCHVGRLIPQLVTFQLDLVARPLPGLGCEEQHGSCSGQATDHEADENVLCTMCFVDALYIGIFHDVISLMVEQ